jgi:UDPglucose 6-dehydrogenase
VSTTPEKEPIGVIGVGWVGLVTAACFAELGHEVVARDIVREKIDALSAGDVPIYEPGLTELVEKNRERLAFTTEIGEVVSRARLLFCCVDTPPTYSGDADLSRVEQVIEELGDSNEHALVMKSTVPVGTGRSIMRRRDGLGYISNPEFLKEGTAIADFMQPDRVVIGADSGSVEFAERVAGLYAPLGGELVRTDVASAEMIKLASNAFLATKISFINEIANICEELGADVTEVARGMGMDDRIGPKFLRAGIGWGGSCLAGDETVLVRRQGRVWMWTLEELFERIAEEQDLEPDDASVLWPDELQVLSWQENASAPQFLPVAAATRRRFDGEIVELRTKMGRRLRCTPDHPFVTGDGGARATGVTLAGDLTTEDWLPLALGAPHTPRARMRVDAFAGALATGMQAADLLVRPAPEEVAALRARDVRERSTALDHPRGSRIRIYDIARTGVLRLDEAARLGLDLGGASAGTASHGTEIPFRMELDEEFWRVAGLYIAEGHCSVESDGRHRLQWSFHPTDEDDLVDCVASFWRQRGVKATVYRAATAKTVSVSSRPLAGWWIDVLGMGRNCYEQRIPDAAWAQTRGSKRALLAGMWLGDGSWGYVAPGPSITLEYGTVSRELADGILRLLGELGLVASLRVGRTAKSTCDTYWITISGADQVESALDLVGEADRPAIRASLARQAKRTRPTGYRRSGRGTAWVRVVAAERRPFRGAVYSLEVPGAHTFVTTAGLVAHNCFGKDVLSLKQLASNTGYHFQLLTAVTEVNDLQKRRTIGKLQKHLGPLVGKTIALLGISFKPDTDDVRDATSLVLAARLHGEGAHVRAYDPVAGERAREVLVGTDVCESALDAVDGADAVVLVTEWPEFAELDWEGEVKPRLATPLVIDGRNFLDRDALEAAGFTYEGIGR